MKKKRGNRKKRKKERTNENEEIKYERKRGIERKERKSE